ncbi:MAG: CBS domain-containing protein, partial [Gammaproteobacteria bacterium]
GMTAIVNDDNKIVGIFTDGDLRRTIDSGSDLQTTIIDDVMTTDCKTINKDVLAAEAIRMMETNAVTALLVADDESHLVGAFNVHDLLHAGAM